ncbi:MAG TPA: hypothetical protein VEU96_03290 [Bryobacteraceae bacterium]|nr:hypothetical protein [Bryobacteraceae bacterium]
MHVGHFAVGLAAKRIEPRISLGTAVLAATFADFVFFLLSIAGIERAGFLPNVATNRFFGYDIAYSHSLFIDVVWASSLALIYLLCRRYPRGAWILFATVLSHWLLDVVSHRPDMPLAPGVHVTLGLGLWNSPLATLAVEGGCWLLAIILYVRATHPKNRAGTYAFWIGVAILTFFGAVNVLAMKPPPNPVQAGIVSLVYFSLVVGWAYWMNRLRVVYNR